MKKHLKSILLGGTVLTIAACTKFDDKIYDASAVNKPDPGVVYAELRDLIDDNGWWFWAQEVFA